MIIDNHVHVFPSQAGPVGYPDAKIYQRQLQAGIPRFWGRWETSHTDPRYMPLPDEEVDFRVGKFGRYYWHKNGEECWLQRGSVVLEEMEYRPEQLLAQMDFVGVDMAIIQAGYMEINYGRDEFMPPVFKRWPDRFIAVAAIDLDLKKDDQYLDGEVRKLTRAVEEFGYRGLFLNHPATAQPLDDPRCDRLWKEVTRLGVPVHINTGLNPKKEYLEQIQRIGNVMKRYPELYFVNAHIGSNVRHPRDPEHVDNPREFFPLFEIGRFFLEVGYVLSYENPHVWGRDYEYPYPRQIDIMKAAYENYGPTSLVWGSDMPWALRSCTYRQNLDSVKLHTDFMTDEDRALVIGGNLARIHGIKER